MTEQAQGGEPKRSPAKRRRKKAKKPVARGRKAKLQEALLKLTVRQIQYRKNRLSGMTVYNAAVAAGYGRGYARTQAHQKLERMVKHSIIEELNIQGATNEWQASRAIFLATKATKRQNCTIEVTDNEGNLTIEDSASIEVPDYHVQLHALEHIARLKKQINAPQSQVPFGDFTQLIIVVPADPVQPKGEIIDVTASTESGINAPSGVSLAVTDK